ncbi:uridine diphosphate-N-acetylglucosamine-binding protein YvcK [Candidatus Woesearchaeota archaeon]|nr:uridine diphosphate-N-acetylglucosamine-binding protein YvcK [Candidatus Woesearchaeota archaeon]
MVKIVCIGGGTGQSKLLQGLREVTTDLVAIVGVTDNGRSTGVLRNEFDMLAPGDIRNCLVALSNSPKVLKELFQFRFTSINEDSAFYGMNFGNLLIAALTKINNDNFGEAIKEVSKILKIEGKVLPSTLANTQVCAELSTGKVLVGEPEIARAYGTKKKIKRLFLKDKNVKANQDCIDEIMSADLVVIGPGGLYTSVIVNLLPIGMVEALKNTTAKKVYVANVATQQGVTDDLNLYDHVKEIEKYVGKGVLDAVVVNNRSPPKRLVEKYRAAGAYFLEIDDAQIAKIKTICKNVILADIVQRKFVEEFGKANYIRHNPKKLASVLLRIPRKKVKGVILVAGKGERMKPFSLNKSKEMIEFMGKPLIARHATEMIKNGITDIIFICNEENIGYIKDYFQKDYIPTIEKDIGMGLNVNLEFVLQIEQKGPVNAILYARSLLEKDYFVIKYGDSLASDDQIKQMLATFDSDTSVDAVATLRKVTKPQEYGIARFNKNNELVEIVEKPQKDFPSDLANVGLALVNGKVFFNSIDRFGVGEVLPPVEYVLRNKGRASFWIFKGKRVDVGRVWNILDAYKLLIDKLRNSKPRILSKNVSNTVKIGKGVYIGRNAKIGKNVTLGDYSSIDGIVEDNCVISNSVIMAGTVIGSGSKISYSVIGENTKIGKNFYTKTKSSDVEVFCKDKYVLSGKNTLGLFCANDVVIGDNLYSEPGKMIFPNKIVNQNITTDLLLRAIIFDADNTIYQTKEVAKLADMAAMTFFSGQTNKSPEYLYNYWIKNIVSKLVADKNPIRRHRKYSYTLLCNKFKVRNIDGGFEAFLGSLTQNIQLSPGFRELLPALSSYKVALLTEDTRDVLDAKLKRFRLSNLFDSVISSTEIGVMKPSQEYFDSIISSLGVSPSECLFVGDNYTKDLAIPKKNGTNVLLFSLDGKGDFKDFSELVKILAKL